MLLASCTEVGGGDIDIRYASDGRKMLHRNCEKFQIFGTKILFTLVVKFFQIL